MDGILRKVIATPFDVFSHVFLEVCWGTRGKSSSQSPTRSTRGTCWERRGEGNHRVKVSHGVPGAPLGVPGAPHGGPGAPLGVPGAHAGGGEANHQVKVPHGVPGARAGRGEERRGEERRGEERRAEESRGEQRRAEERRAEERRGKSSSQSPLLKKLPRTYRSILFFIGESSERRPWERVISHFFLLF